MATIKEVARKAKVSVGTVSNVVSGRVPVSASLRERVERIIHELNYQPDHVARSLRSRCTQTLGMVISDITNPFFPLVIRGAEDAALEQGYMLTVFNTDDKLERERRVFAMLRSRRVDGVLAVVTPDSADAPHLKDMMGIGVPVVFLDRMPAKPKSDAVVVDNVKGASVCMRHLISMGHRRIGIISGSPRLQTAIDRLSGCRQALKEAGIRFDPELVREGDFRAESGYRMAKDLCLSHPRPTALFVANGTMGLGALKALQHLALKCPEDVALAVFDDVPGGDVFHPTLTVVSQPAYELGHQATELLIKRITGSMTSKAPITLTLQPELLVRDSTMDRKRAR